MKYNRFEDLPVWQDAADLAVKVYEFTEAEPLQRHYGLRDQLERATLSISNNVLKASNVARPTSCWPFSTSLVAPPERFGLCFV